MGINKPAMITADINTSEPGGYMDPKER